MAHSSQQQQASVGTASRSHHALSPAPGVPLTATDFQRPPTFDRTRDGEVTYRAGDICSLAWLHPATASSWLVVGAANQAVSCFNPVTGDNKDVVLAVTKRTATTASGASASSAMASVFSTTAFSSSSSSSSRAGTAFLGSRNSVAVPSAVAPIPRNGPAQQVPISGLSFQQPSSVAVFSSPAGSEWRYAVIASLVTDAAPAISRSASAPPRAPLPVTVAPGEATATKDLAATATTDVSSSGTAQRDVAAVPTSHAYLCMAYVASPDAPTVTRTLCVPLLTMLPSSGGGGCCLRTTTATGEGCSAASAVSPLAKHLCGMPAASSQGADEPTPAATAMSPPRVSALVSPPPSSLAGSVATATATATGLRIDDVHLQFDPLFGRFLLIVLRVKTLAGKRCSLIGVAEVRHATERNELAFTGASLWAPQVTDQTAPAATAQTPHYAVTWLDDAQPVDLTLSAAWSSAAVHGRSTAMRVTPGALPHSATVVSSPPTASSSSSSSTLTQQPGKLQAGGPLQLLLLLGLSTGAIAPVIVGTATNAAGQSVISFTRVPCAPPLPPGSTSLRLTAAITDTSAEESATGPAMALPFSLPVSTAPIIAIRTVKLRPGALVVLDTHDTVQSIKLKLHHYGDGGDHHAPHMDGDAAMYPYLEGCWLDGHAISSFRPTDVSAAAAGVGSSAPSGASAVSRSLIENLVFCEETSVVYVTLRSRQLTSLAFPALTALHGTSSSANPSAATAASRPSPAASSGSRLVGARSSRSMAEAATMKPVASGPSGGGTESLSYLREDDVERSGIVTATSAQRVVVASRHDILLLR